MIDFAMPETGGCGFLRLAPSELGLSDAPAIAATAHAFDQFGRAAEQAGFNEFIVKLYEPMTLVELVARVTSRTAPSP